MATVINGFSGFSDAALGFYEGLEADNSKAYWADHKQVFEESVLAPMLALSEALEDEFGTPKLFRPYRDVRFSADKSPYKNHQGATFTRAPGHPQFYLQVSATGLFLGGGYYHFAKDQLSRYRESLEHAKVGGELVRITDALVTAGLSLGGETLTRTPRGVDADHPHADLLRHKGLVGLRDVGAPRWLATRRTATEVTKVFRTLEPLFGWLLEHVGPAEETEGDPRRARAGRVTARER